MLAMISSDKGLSPASMAQHIDPLVSSLTLSLTTCSSHQAFDVFMQIWLLREGIIMQVHKFVHLVLPASFPAMSSKQFSQPMVASLVPVRSVSDSGVLSSSEAMDGEVPLSPAELQALESHERAGRNPEVYGMLLRLGKYFRGRCCMQEIAWREGVSVNNIERVCEEFRRIVVVSQRPA